MYFIKHLEMYWAGLLLSVPRPASVSLVCGLRVIKGWSLPWAIPLEVNYRSCNNLDVLVYLLTYGVFFSTTALQIVVRHSITPRFQLVV